MSDQLLTMNDLTDRYQVSRKTIQNWISRGAFPKPLRVGGETLRWRPDDVREYELQIQAQEGDS